LIVNFHACNFLSKISGMALVPQKITRLDAPVCDFYSGDAGLGKEFYDHTHLFFRHR
jgi:hypothetical protein